MTGLAQQLRGGPFDWVSAIQPIKRSRTMQYLLMIYRSEAEAGQMDAAARQAMSADERPGNRGEDSLSPAQQEAWEELAERVNAARSVY